MLQFGLLPRIVKCLTGMISPDVQLTPGIPQNALTFFHQKELIDTDCGKCPTSSVDSLEKITWPWAEGEKRRPKQTVGAIGAAISVPRRGRVQSSIIPLSTGAYGNELE